MNGFEFSLMNVLVGSTNPTKIDAVRLGFAYYFPEVAVQGYDVSSDVAAQPVGEQTFEGARNRVLRLREMSPEQHSKGDYFVGIEGGIEQLCAKWFSFGVICIMDREGRIGWGTSSYFQLPKGIVEELRRGKELGDIIDAYTGVEHTKLKNGAIGFLTRDVITRTSLYVPGVVTALIPFVNKELYSLNKIV